MDRRRFLRLVAAPVLGATFSRLVPAEPTIYALGGMPGLSGTPGSPELASGGWVPAATLDFGSGCYVDHWTDVYRVDKDGWHEFHFSPGESVSISHELCRSLDEIAALSDKLTRTLDDRARISVI